MSERVPAPVVEQVVAQLDRVGIGADANPIKRVAFVVIADDNHCRLEDLLGVEPEGQVTAKTYARAQAGTSDAILALLASIRRANEEHYEAMKAHFDARMDRLTRDVSAMRTTLQ